jgi:transcriptional regulator with XRE-family HTH domain
MTPEQIREARKSLGLTLEQVADLCGLHSVTIASIERGLHAGSPGKARVEKLLRDNAAFRRLEIAEPYPVTAKVQALVDELRELRERLEGQRAKLEEVLA